MSTKKVVAEDMKKPSVDPKRNVICLDDWMSEYDSAAKWCAQRGYKGDFANQLPEGISEKVFWEISNDVEAFQQRIRETAYALAMEKKI